MATSGGFADGGVTGDDAGQDSAGPGSLLCKCTHGPMLFVLVALEPCVMIMATWVI